MTELEKLIGNVRATVEENISLTEERETKAGELADKCMDNYVRLIQGTFRTCHALAKELTYKFDFPFREQSEHVFLKYNGRDRQLAYISIFGDDRGRREFRLSDFSSSTEFNDTFSVLKNSVDSTLALSKILSTEEKAMALLEEMTSLYSHFFKGVIEKIHNDNSELRTTIQNLSYYLENSSVVKEEKDGSIEIHLNGKTYKGTLVEE